MKNEIERKRLYKRAFDLLDQAAGLLRAARKRHELAVKNEDKKAA